MRIIIFLLCVSVLGSACRNNPADSPEQGGQTAPQIQAEQSNHESPDRKGSIFKSEGFYRALNSEWIQISLTDDQDSIVGIWYWNSNDETVSSMRVENVNRQPGDFFELKGDIYFPLSGDGLTFRMQKDGLYIYHSDGRLQEFRPSATE